MEHLQCKQLPFHCDLESQSKLTNANRIPRTFLNAPNMEFLFARNPRINKYQLTANKNTIIWTALEASIIKVAFQDFSIHKWKTNALLELKTEHIKDLTAVKPLLKAIESYLISNRRLNLNLHRSGAITDKQVAEIAAKITRSLTQLHQLTFHFSRCDRITDQGVQALAFEIAKHSSDLKLLKLNFHNCNKIQGPGIETLATKISKYLPDLKHLVLDFSDGFSYKVVLSLTLANIYRKRYMTAKSPLTNKTIEIIDSTILRSLTDLESLTINFFGCKLITPQAVEALARKIASNLKKLKYLDFSFS